jgi:hypothetical protein
MKLTADIKDMMSYQLNSFQRSSTGLVKSDSLDLGQGHHMAMAMANEDLSPPPTPTVTLMAIPPSYAEDIDTGSGSNSKKGIKTAMSPSESCRCNSATQYYCAECERETKKSRTIRFGSGGDVTIDKTSNSYVNVPGSGEGETCFTVSFKVPSTFDLNSIRNRRLNISISISENPTRKSNSFPVAESDYEFIMSTKRLLGQCGWYYGRMDWQESIRLLNSTPVGTFILRDSGDPHYLFSLSCQTEFGPISSRISYSERKFRLDSSDRVSYFMPSFSSILTLVEHYIKYGLVKNSGGRQVWVDATGRTFSPVHLTKPKMKSVGTLQHLSRVAVNKILPTIPKGSIPPKMKNYIDEYPYTV